MHVNAVNKSDVTYEHIVPELVGNQQRILVGELSGRTNVMLKARELGIEPEEKDPRTKQILDQIKTLEHEGYEFEAADASFELLVRKGLGTYQPAFRLEEYHTTFRKKPALAAANCEATLHLSIDGQDISAVAKGDGPVNALDQALRKALTTSYPSITAVSLIDYKVRIIDSSSGTAARTRVLIISSDGNDEWGTVGVSDNVIEASWLALVDSVEYYLLKKSGR